MSARAYDAVVLGAGPAGEVAISRLAEQGLKVALVERELIGGECGYWACIPPKTPSGELGLIADRARGVLLGAWAVAPLAGEWIHYAALAIKTETPLAVLRDTVAQFPTFTEAYLKGFEQL